MSAPIVHFDIAGPASAGLQAFYSKLFGWNAEANGQISVRVNSPLSGTIRHDPFEKRIYIGVDDIDIKLSEIKSSGGSIDAPRFEVPGVAVIGLFTDPAGNQMGLVELQGDKPKVP